MCRRKKFYAYIKKLKGYIKDNPVEGIKNIREEAKQRDAMTEDQLAQMRSYLEANDDRHFLLACMKEYYTFIRPEELTCLRIGDFHLKGDSLEVHEETKNFKGKL